MAIECAQAETIEQIQIMQDVVLDGVERGVVAGFTEIGIVRNDDFPLRGPGVRKRKSGEGPGAVQEDEL
jgi:hypothetical protein